MFFLKEKMSNISISKKNFLIIRDYIHSISGIFLDMDKDYLIKQRLEPLLRLYSIDSFDVLSDMIKNETINNYKEDIISSITTNETLFFRDKHPFDTFYNYLLPKMLIQIRHKFMLNNFQKSEKSINIWCAGTSTGQEPYSLAILINEYITANFLPGFYKNSFYILATDISKQVIEQSKQGIYNQVEISRGLSDERLTKFFIKNKQNWQICPEVRNMIDFRQSSLHDSMFFTETQIMFDIIFARNILIYFDFETKEKVILKFHKQLVTEGFLILGASENLYGYEHLFKSVTYGNTLLYKKIE